VLCFTSKAVPGFYGVLLYCCCIYGNCVYYTIKSLNSLVPFAIEISGVAIAQPGRVAYKSGTICYLRFTATFVY